MCGTDALDAATTRLPRSEGHDSRDTGRDGGRGTRTGKAEARRRAGVGGEMRYVVIDATCKRSEFVSGNVDAVRGVEIEPFLVGEDVVGGAV